MAKLLPNSTLIRSGKYEEIASKNDISNFLLNNKVTKSEFPVETGSFAPIVRGSSTAGNNSYSTSSGVYTRLGDIIIFKLSILLSSKDPNMSGNVYISGLPFTPIQYTAVNVGPYEGVSHSGKEQLTAYITTSSSRYIVLLTQDYKAGTRSSLPVSSISTTFRISLSGTYIKA